MLKSIFCERKSPNQGTYMGAVIAHPPEQCATTAKTSECQRAGHKRRGVQGARPPALFLRLSPEKAGLPPGVGRGNHAAGLDLRWSKPDHLPTAESPPPGAGLTHGSPALCPARAPAYFSSTGWMQSRGTAPPAPGNSRCSPPGPGGGGSAPRVRPKAGSAAMRPGGRCPSPSSFTHAGGQGGVADARGGPAGLPPAFTALHEDVLRGHEGELLLDVLGDDLFVDHQVGGHVLIEVQDGIHRQKASDTEIRLLAESSRVRSNHWTEAVIAGFRLSAMTYRARAQIRSDRMGLRL